MDKKLMLAVVAVLLVLGGLVWFRTQSLSGRQAGMPNDVYYDANGCAQSRHGAMRPTFCKE
jgi:hypothetical protein